MKVSTPSGRCGPCCSIAASGSTAIQRSVSAPAISWQEIAGAETERWIAVLPLAAIEQHGPHLPLGVDTFIAEGYLERVYGILPENLAVTFLPVQRIGVSAEHLSYPGTLTVSAPTAIAAWTEIGESLSRAGVRKL